jgi:hypothetical protein
MSRSLLFVSGSTCRHVVGTNVRLDGGAAMGLSDLPHFVAHLDCGRVDAKARTAAPKMV